MCLVFFPLIFASCGDEEGSNVAPRVTRNLLSDLGPTTSTTAPQPNNPSLDSVEPKEPTVVVSHSPIVPGNWADFAVDPANPLRSLKAEAVAEGWFQAGHQYAMLIQTRFPSQSAEFQGLVWATHAPQREKAFSIPIRLTTNEADRELMHVSFECKSQLPNSKVSAISGCPFKFREMNLTDPHVVFEFKKNEPPNRAQLGGNSGYVFFENVYSIGVDRGFLVEIIMTLSHPNLKESIQVMIGSFPLWLHW